MILERIEFMNIKKSFIVFLCFVLVFGFGSGFFAYAQNDISMEDKAGEYLRQLGLYTGYEDGSLGLNRNITRAEFATLAVRIEGLEDLQAENQGKTIFKDMAADHWASGYVNIAVSKDLVKGFEDTTFRPEEQITYVQALAVIIRILGYDGDVEGTWPNNYIDKGRDLGLDKHITLSPNAPISRGKIAVLIYNALNISIK